MTDQKKITSQEFTKKVHFLHYNRTSYDLTP